jgi:hypothetical protein
VHGGKESPKFLISKPSLFGLQSSNLTTNNVAHHGKPPKEEEDELQMLLTSARRQQIGIRHMCPLSRAWFFLAPSCT